IIGGVHDKSAPTALSNFIVHLCFLRRNFSECSVANSGKIVIVGVISWLNVLIMMLDEQPGFLSARTANANQCEGTLQLLSIEPDFDIAHLQSLPHSCLSFVSMRNLLPDTLPDLSFRGICSLIP